MGQRVLVVDDEGDARLLVRLTLEREGFVVTEAGDGDSALASFRNEPPDLVLLDVRLPARDGLSVLRAMREGGHVPVLIVSAYASSAVADLAAESGADGFVIKPFRADALVAAVRAALARGDGSAPQPAT